MQITTDKDLFDLMQQHLYSGVICDVLDELGFRNQAMREDIRPLVADSVLVGRAKTILFSDVYHIHDKPYEMEINAIDSVKSDEVVVVSTNESHRNGPWGELLSMASKMRGARGAIIGGLIRDTKKIRELGFPVFCTGFKPVDSKGRGIVINYDCPVEVGNILVNPGDVIFADYDGVVVIPKQVVEATVDAAMRKVQTENQVRDGLVQGKLLGEVYEQYGVL